MDGMQRLLLFFDWVDHDPRISSRHLAMFSALTIYHSRTNRNPFAVERNVMMRLSKINSRHTYNRVLNELHEYGYINYIPSYAPGRSAIELIDPFIFVKQPL